MTPEQKIKALGDAYTTIKHGDEYRVIINDKSPIAAVVMIIQSRLDEEVRSFDLSYQIMQDACLQLHADGDSGENLKDRDYYADEHASVYTSTRLSWLNANNQHDITEIAKEYDCDIATACAVWYDRNVHWACNELRNWVLETD